MNVLSHARAAIAAVRSETDRCLLFHSGGKDSIALLDLLAGEFREVALVHMYFVRGLAHLEAYLRDAERRHPNVRVLQKPHWCLGYVRRAGLYCPAEPGARLKKLSDVTEEARADTGIRWAFFGMKKADSLARRVMLMGYEAQSLNRATQKAYPLSLWRNGQVLDYIRARGLPPPVRYGIKASGGVGLNADCLLWMRANHPADYRRFLAAFPMAEAILFGK